MSFVSTYSTCDVVPGAELPQLTLPQASDSNGYENGKWHVLMGPTSETGQTVTPSTALSHGPVFAGVSLIAGDIGQLPWHKMVRKGRYRSKDREHPVEQLLRTRPNHYQTWSVWLESMVAWAYLWGNSCSYVHWQNGRVAGLYPLLPDRTGYVKEDGEYWIWSWVNNQQLWFRPDELFHLRGLATNGFWGESFVSVCRNVLAHGLALRAHGNAVWKNGARPSVAVKHPKVMNQEARENFRREWLAKHAGVEKGGTPVMLWEGMELTPYQISNVDAQWLEAMKLDPVQVAVLLQVPPHMLGALENSAVRANLEDQTRGYFNRCLGRPLNKLNEQARLTLVTARELASVDPFHYFRWYIEAFLKGDIKARFSAYQVAIQSRIFSPNECREMEDMDPYEGGDEYLNPNVDLAGGKSGAAPPETDEEREEAVANLVRSQCQALCEFEANKLAWGAKHAKAWDHWVCDFYGAEGTYLKAAERLLAGVGHLATLFGGGGDWKAACDAHVAEALSWTMSCDREVLAAKNEGLTTTITGRAGALTAHILGDETDGC